MKSVDLKELIQGLLVVVFAALAVGRLDDLHRWAKNDFFKNLNRPFTAPARLSTPKDLGGEARQNRKLKKPVKKELVGLAFEERLKTASSKNRGLLFVRFRPRGPPR